MPGESSSYCQSFCLYFTLSLPSRGLHNVPLINSNLHFLISMLMRSPRQTVKISHTESIFPTSHKYVNATLRAGSGEKIPDSKSIFRFHYGPFTET